VHGVLGQAARLDGGEVALQFRGRELIESPDGPLREVALDMLPIPIDRLRASTEHLQVKQPITIQRFKRRLTVAVRGRRDVVNTFRTCGIDRSGYGLSGGARLILTCLADSDHCLREASATSAVNATGTLQISLKANAKLCA